MNVPPGITASPDWIAGAVVTAVLDAGCVVVRVVVEVVDVGGIAVVVVVMAVAWAVVLM